MLKAVPLAAKLWRLTACREVILSGFHQELYAPMERPIAYWRLSCVLDVHLGCIEELLPIVPLGSSIFLCFARDIGLIRVIDIAAHRELTFQAEHLAALQMISTTLVAVSRSVHRW